MVVPTWTLLAALTAGLILGALGSRLFLRSTPPVTPVAPPIPEEPAPEPPAAFEPEPAPPEAPPAPPAPAPEPEPVRISMEDVVSELERRYQGRQADAAAEKPRSTTRRRRRPR